MTDKQRQILAQLKAAVEASKASIRVRIIDRAFAQLAAACLMLAVCASAEARTVSRPVGLWINQGNRTTVVLYAPPIRQTNVTVYQTNVIQPACSPAPAPIVKERYRPSKYSPSR